MKPSSGPCRLRYLAVAPSFIFILAGWSKLADPTALVMFFRLGLGFHAYGPAMMISYGVGACELLIGVAMLWSMTGTSRLAFLAGVCMYMFFIGLLLAIIQKNNVADIECGCFGSLQMPFVGRSFVMHFALNATMGAICLLCSYLPIRRQRHETANGVHSA